MAAIVGDRWTVQTIDDYQGYLSILVEPNEHTSDKPSYLISGTTQQIELAEFRDGAIRRILQATAVTDIANELSHQIQT